MFPPDGKNLDISQILINIEHLYSLYPLLENLSLVQLDGEYELVTYWTWYRRYRCYQTFCRTYWWTVIKKSPYCHNCHMTWTDSGIMPELLRRFVVCEISATTCGSGESTRNGYKGGEFQKTDSPNEIDYSCSSDRNCAISQSLCHIVTLGTRSGNFLPFCDHQNLSTSICLAKRNIRTLQKESLKNR